MVLFFPREHYSRVERGFQPQNLIALNSLESERKWYTLLEAFF